MAPYADPLPPARKRLLFAAAAGGLAVLGAVLLSEAAYRAARRFACLDHGRSFHELDAQVGWKHQAGARAVNSACIGRRFEFRIEVETSSRGLCDGELGYGRTAGAGRVVLLGDSVAEATQVEKGRGFADLLEADFASRGRVVEVVNGGVSGYSQVNQLLQWRHEMRRYAPDVVLLELNLQNDAFEISPRLRPRWYIWPGGLPAPGVRVQEDGLLAVDTTPFRDAMARARDTASASRGAGAWLVDNLFMARRLGALMARWLPEPPPATGVAGDAVPDAPTDTAAVDAASHLPAERAMYLEPAPAAWLDAWRLVEAALLSIRREVEADHARLVVAVVPSREMVATAAWEESRRSWGNPPPGLRWDREGPRRRILEILARLGIVAVDLAVPMRAEEAATGSSGFYAVDPHLDETGHRRVASALLPVLEEALGPGGAATAPLAARQASLQALEPRTARRDGRVREPAVSGCRRPLPAGSPQPSS